MPTLRHLLPAYRLHRSSGQAVVSLRGVERYLGPFGSRESRAEYDRLIAEYLQNGRSLVATSGKHSPTLSEIIAAFMQYALKRYQRADGTLTKEVDTFKQALGVLRDHYGHSPADAFGPLALRTVRSKMVEKGWSRKHLNNQVQRIRFMFRWAASVELVDPTTYQALQMVPGLRRGEEGVEESRRVHAVCDAHIDAVKPFVSRQVWAIVELQRLTGARPGEILQMRAVDLDTSDDACWVYRPSHHKTEHHDLERQIILGPRATEIVRGFVVGRPTTSSLFSPAEAEAERRERIRLLRKTLLSQGNRAGTHRQERPQRRAQDHYTTDSYRRAISRACKLAGVSAWHPHQIRHQAATAIAKKFGIETARVVLGHTKISTTDLYIERDMAVAKRAMAQAG